MLRDEGQGERGLDLFGQIAVPIVTLLLGAIIGAVLGFWFSSFATRPKLEANGSGSGTSEGYSQNRLGVSNRPAFVGIRVGRTVIMGKPVHRHFEKGLAVERARANDCVAQLFDADSNEHLAQLWWVRNGAYQAVVSIESGESVELMMFARRTGRPTHYFAFQPAENGSGPKPPPDDMTFSDTRRFRIEISYSYGQQKLIYPLTVRKNFGGQLLVESKNGGGSF